MKKLYKLYQVDAFTKEKFTGNPAGVITNADGLNEEEMQRIARELNNSETAFIFSNNGSDDYDVEVRFFTPKNEVPICGHATIAANYVCAMENKFKSKRIFQKTKSGILPIDITLENNDYKIAMTQNQISVGEKLDSLYIEKLMEALKICKDDIREDCPIVIASTGYSKVMVGIKDIDMLHNLNPDLTKLSHLSKEINCNGYYVFTLNDDKEYLVHGRMFAPITGINEDPVTGNANGPLGAYLVHFNLVNCDENSTFSFKAVQGEAMGRRGVIEVEVKIAHQKPLEIKLKGEAVIAFKSEIEI